MAGVARHAGVVIRGRHLRELARLGGVLLMAADAECGHVGQIGLGRDRVATVGVNGLRTVAGFARDVSMFPGGTCFGLIGVAKDALRLAGEGDRPRPEQVESGGAIMAVFPEGLGDHGLANQEKNAQSGQENQRRAQQMARIPKKSVHTPRWRKEQDRGQKGAPFSKC